MTPQAIVDEARTWLRTPYAHGARLKGIGCDCIGLIAGTGLSVGIPEAQAFVSDPLFLGYSRQPDPMKLIIACDKYLDRVPRSSMQIGDIPVMRFEKEPQHFGFISSIDPLQIIHSYALARRVTEHSLDSLWQGRIVRVYRFRGL